MPDEEIRRVNMNPTEVEVFASSANVLDRVYAAVEALRLTPHRIVLFAAVDNERELTLLTAGDAADIISLLHFIEQFCQGEMDRAAEGETGDA